jgi:spore maturation protein CgeB
VRHIVHVPASDHRPFYTSLRFTLNLTRAAMIRAGYSPSVRLFEAAACGVPIISDNWRGLETIFTPGSEILISNSGRETVRLLNVISDRERRGIARRARRRVLAEHTAEHRAVQLERYLDDARRAATRQTVVSGQAADAAITPP